MQKFEEKFLNFIKNNILIQDLAENVYILEKNRKKSTKQYLVYNFGSDKIVVDTKKNSFFATSSSNRGDVIEFVQFVENIDFVSAVRKIAQLYNLEEETTEFDDIDLQANTNFARTLQLKKKNEEEAQELSKKAEKQIYIYKNLKSAKFIEDIRGISEELLNFLVQQNYFKFYKNDKYSIIKVPLTDKNSEIVGVQDIYFDEKNNKWAKINNGKAGIFSIVSKSADTLVLTEAFFDAVSALQLSYNNKIKKNLHLSFSDIVSELGVISINGSLSELKKEAILETLKQNKNIKYIVFAFDADEVGEKYVKEVTKLLHDVLDKFEIVKISYKNKAKDLNEFLQLQIQKEKELEKDICI